MSNLLDSTPIDLALITEAGFVLITREAFLNEPLKMETFKGMDRTPAEVEKLQSYVIDGLRTRVRLHEGDHVVYDPYDNEDGWLLVGDRKTVIYESAKMTRELLSQ